MPRSPADTRRVVCVLGIDTVREKTLYQTRWLAAHGWAVDILTMHRNAGSLAEDASANIVEVHPSPLARTRQVLAYLLGRRRQLHHVELYVGGRFAFIYAVLCRLLCIPVMVVERGDLLMCQRRVYPLAVRLSIYACYRLANRLWYREPYMGRAFKKWRIRDTFLLPNAVPAPSSDVTRDRDVDFLWVNRLIPERHPDWFARAVVVLAQRRELHATVLGFLEEDADAGRVTELETAVRSVLADVPGADCLQFADPGPYYERARWFVLPADVVFGNFALLEAMSYGVVPIVSDTDGIELLVEHGSNGLVSRHDAPGLLAALEQALRTPDPEWTRMSEAARRTVAERYSVDSWGDRLLTEYARLRG